MSSLRGGGSETRPRLLDLFCCSGGAGMGYYGAGFDVVGVDIEDQPRYPFPFFQHDAMKILDNLASDGHALGMRFDAVHASPPCQMYSRALKHLSAPQPMLIDACRELLTQIGLPWVIENVEGSPLQTSSDLFGAHGAMLCGSAFGMRIYRHRLFETSFPLPSTVCNHSAPAMNPHNVKGRERMYEEHGRLDPERPWREEMGVRWMGRYDGREAIPPAYTRYVGEHMLESARQEMAA